MLFFSLSSLSYYSILILLLSSFINFIISYNILIIQPSDYNYNCQEWERDVVDNTLVELSQIDVLNYVNYHSYDYKRYLNYNIIDYDIHPTWSKVYALYSAMLSSLSPSSSCSSSSSCSISDSSISSDSSCQSSCSNSPSIKYDYIVVLDLDIFFMNYTSSIIDKINEWDPNKQSLIYMPQDTNEPLNHLKQEFTDLYTLNVNTGFQIWKVNEITLEIVLKWKTCLTTYSNCQKWSYDWPFDQGAFNQFIRPQLELNQLNIIPCDEANGFPIEYDNYLIDHDGNYHNLGNHNCNGRFVAHFWEESKRYNHKKLEEFIKKKYFIQQLNKIQINHTIIN